MSTLAMMKIVEDIRLLNELVVNPEPCGWGDMSEEADDHYNNVESPLYDEWGDKSMNMIIWIKHLEDIKDDMEIGRCPSCNIKLDHLRDGTTTEGHRCSPCYWDEEGSL